LRLFEVQRQLVGFGDLFVLRGRFADRNRARRLVGGLDIEVLGFGVCRDRCRQHHRLLRLLFLFFLVLVLVVVFVLVEVLVEFVLGRPPVRIASMPGRRSRTLEQSAAARPVEDPRRQRHIARAPHGVALADQHRNQHEEPEHYERDPEE
jgi:predicted nucleic acid-binding Zn ribbon protein